MVSHCPMKSPVAVPVRPYTDRYRSPEVLDRILKEGEPFARLG
jgi:hypothetical protein